MQAENVSARRNVAGCRRQLDRHLPGRGLDAELPRFLLRHRPALTVEPAAPENDRHAEAGCTPDHLLSDAADAEQAQRPAVQPLRL